ncbi:IS66 family transposase, partial [Paenibacillus sp. y28]|uniref:IS66 family transposase n=1 Tax=Paenibacillus sp. y28 TaxID=3129110 RepID=UPI003016F2C1
MKNESESLTLEQLRQHNAELEQENTKQARELAELSAKLKWYEEQFRLAQQKRFGASSEKTDPDQVELNLFNEAEILATPAGQEPEMEKVTYARRKTTGKREEALSRLPVETVTYQLAEGEQSCACCGGSLHEMSTETRSEIAIVPPQVKVVRHVRQVYACRHCERHEIKTPIVTAPMPKPVYPGSLASPSAMAHVMCQKYVDSLPLHRQEQQFARLGYTLSRQTMANWMIYGAEQWLMPVVSEMKRYLLKQEALHADETTLQVLR